MWLVFSSLFNKDIDDDNDNDKDRSGGHLEVAEDVVGAFLIIQQRQRQRQIQIQRQRQIHIIEARGGRRGSVRRFPHYSNIFPKPTFRWCYRHYSPIHHSFSWNHHYQSHQHLHHHQQYQQQHNQIQPGKKIIQVIITTIFIINLLITNKNTMMILRCDKGQRWTKSHFPSHGDWSQ